MARKKVPRFSMQRLGEKSFKREGAMAEKTDFGIERDNLFIWIP